MPHIPHRPRPIPQPAAKPATPAPRHPGVAPEAAQPKAEAKPKPQRRVWREGIGEINLSKFDVKPEDVVNALFGNRGSR